MLILTTFLTSCSGVKELSIFKEEVPRAKLNLEKPTPLQMEKIQWHIITSENAAEVFAKLEKDGKSLGEDAKKTAEKTADENDIECSDDEATEESVLAEFENCPIN